MMMIVLRLLSRAGLKSRWHRHFSLLPLNEVFFQGGGVSVDSWTLGPKPLCHRHPTGPQLSGLLWTPAEHDSMNTVFALALQRLPNLLGRERHVEMAHAERRQRIEHRVADRGRRAVGRQLAEA